MSEEAEHHAYADMMMGSDYDFEGEYSDNGSDDFGMYSEECSADEEGDTTLASKVSESENIGVTKRSRSGIKYIVRTPEEVVKWMEASAEELAEEFDLSMAQSRRLLAHNEYKAEVLREPLKYELEATLNKAGLKFGFSDEMDEDGNEEEDTVTCDICYEDVNVSETDCLECGHRFCRNCWKRHVTESVQSTYVRASSESSSSAGASLPALAKTSSLDRKCVVGLRCPHQMCGMKLDLRMLQEYGGKVFLEKRNIWYAEDMVSKVSKLKQCKAVNCNNIIEFDCTKERIESTEAEVGELECSCGHWFCWTCLREAHCPCSCEEVNDWRSLSSEDAAIERLKAKCKLCPGCGTGCYINDKTACNHMICPCGFEWCWMCGGPWSEHGNSYYNCTKYQKASNKDDIKKKNLERDKKIADIQRLHQFEERVSRMAAGSTGKGAKALRSKVTKMTSDLQSKCGLTKRELQFLWDAFHAVQNMKRMLKWSTVFLFFRPDDDGDLERTLFENQCSRLEFMCDVLHEKLEPLKKEDEKAFKEFLGTSEEKRKKFWKWKASILSLVSQISKYGAEITGAALKGTTIIDEGERSKLQKKLAKQRLKLIDWQFLDDGKWTDFDASIAEQLEFSKLTRAKSFSSTSKEGFTRFFDLVKRVETRYWDSTAAAAAEKKKSPDKSERPIRRQVKAKLAINTWKCAKCKYQTPNDLNCCTNCGTVKGH
eukprot:g4504.t1